MNGSILTVVPLCLFDWLRVLHILVLFCYVQGCQTFTLKVAYQPTDAARPLLDSENTPVTLFLPPVEDQRTNGAQSLNVCFAGSANTYRTDRPPTDIVRDALAAELTRLGVRVSRTAIDTQGRFKGALKRFEVCRTNGTSTVEIQAELRVQEGASVLWSESLKSKIDLPDFSVTSPTFEADLSSGVSHTLSAAVQQLAQNSGFAQALANLTGRPPLRPPLEKPLQRPSIY